MVYEIKFNKKITIQRPFSALKDAVGEYDIIRQFESDRGRILNSSALRRLQQKTQVFPLETNSSVRSRLTHSMEVQQVGRYIAKEIVNKLKRQGAIDSLGLTHYLDSFESLVEMACLMHDIGNPPFGHFGEAAINDWFNQYLANQNKRDDIYSPLKHQNKEDELNVLRKKVYNDLCHFEGNAQAIRLVHHLQKLNLTYAQVACILKYTRPAYWVDAIPTERHYLMKKPGYYLSEEVFVEQLWQALDMQKYSRYPLTYIMEAADDISYCIADLEDAVEKSILTVKQLYSHLEAEWLALRGIHKVGDLFDRTVGEAYRRGSNSGNYRSNSDQFFMTMRVETINTLVPYVANRFIDNLLAIFNGSFNQPIIDDQKHRLPSNWDEKSCLLHIYKNVAVRYVFNHQEVEELELQGYRIITGLLDIYSPLLAVPYLAFGQLVNDKAGKKYLVESRLYHKLSIKHRFAYREAVADLAHLPLAEQQVWEFYYRTRLLQDYISGMTDHYAYDEFRKLSVSG